MRCIQYQYEFTTCAKKWDVEVKSEDKWEQR